jgi:ribosomal protein S18 acetylase RimI-like enzyme
MIEIRIATISDAEYISLLGRVTYTESHGNYIEDKENLQDFYKKYYSVSRIREEISDVKNIFWIVFSDELPVGFAKLSLDLKHPISEENNTCKLLRLYILNDFIALKIGSKLQEIILKKATDLQYQCIWLSAYYKNKKAINFYKKYGFKEVGKMDFFVGETNYPNLIFAKDL